MSQNHPGSMAVVSLVVLAFFGWMISLRWHDIKGSHFIDTRTLASTTGTIVSSNIETEPNKNGTHYHYNIVFEYMVDGQEYHSNGVTFSYTGMKEPEFAESYIRKYPVGKL